MKNVDCWREPTATTTTADHHRQLDALVTTARQQKIIIDDISTVWLSIQRMVAVHQEHLIQPRRPPSTPASLLAARLELQRLSMPGRCQQVDSNVDEEVSQLLCRAPSPQLPHPAGRHRTKRRAAGGPAGRRDINVVGDPAVCVGWTERGAGCDETSPCRLQRRREHFKRPCLDFDKMQAS